MRLKLGYGIRHIKKLLALLLLLPTMGWACGYNGSGTYVRCFNWTQDAQNGIPITASRFDTEDNGFAAGLTSVMTLNGQSTVTANLPMSGFYFTNVGNAITTTNFAAAGQVQNNEFNYGMENGSSINAYVVGSGNVTPAALHNGQLLWWRAPNTNTASSTLNWDALGAKPILKNGTTALSAGDLISGTWYGEAYDSTVSAWVPITPVANSANPSWYNILNIPTQVQNVSNSGIISLTSLNLSTTLLVSGSATFNSGIIVTGTVTATTITATTINANMISATTINGITSPTLLHYYESPAEAITSAGVITLTTNINAIPKMLTGTLTNTTAEGGFSIGDILNLGYLSAGNGTTAYGAAVVVNNSNTIVIRYGSNGSVFVTNNKGTGGNQNLTNGDWTLTLHAIY